MNRVLSILWMAVIATFALAIPGNAAVVVIDDFDSGAFSITQPGDGTSATSTQGPLPTTSIIGGFRDSTVVNAPGTTFAPFNTVLLDVSGGEMTFAALTTAGSATVNYDGVGIGGGFTAVDVTSGGTNNTFVLSVTSLTPGIVPITISVTTGLGTSTQTLTPLSTGALSFSFAGFSGSAGAFTGVTRIGLTIATTNPSGGNISFSQFTAAPVPEPTSLALIGMALLPLGVGAYRRRARRATETVA